MASLLQLRVSGKQCAVASVACRTNGRHGVVVQPRLLCRAGVRHCICTCVRSWILYRAHPTRPLASCLLPLASCLLPLASCLLPLATARARACTQCHHGSHNLKPVWQALRQRRTPHSDGYGCALIMRPRIPQPTNVCVCNCARSSGPPLRVPTHSACGWFLCC